jgi:hypothetical protein
MSDSTVNNETPLDMAVRLLADGSRAEFARLLNVNRSTVTGWANPRRRAEGLCGVIPQQYVRRVLALAKARKINLKPAALHPQR